MKIEKKLKRPAEYIGIAVGDEGFLLLLFVRRDLNCEVRFLRKKEKKRLKKE